nr:MAG TPA: DNA polymerase [Caudoviricetes sp.]
MGGWIKIYQTIREHWIWERPRYLKWWIDLLMLAEWEDKKKSFGSTVFVIKRGQLAASVSYLRKRWEYIDDNEAKRTPSPRTILNFLSMLEEDGMIVKDTNVLPNRITLITICNYNNYQGDPISGDADHDNTLDNTDDTASDTTRDTEYKNIRYIRQYREGKSGKSEKRFSPPSIEEVDSYIQEKGYTVDAERFVNFYESKGWYVGKNKMKNWHAAVATWQKGDDKRNGNNQQRSDDKRRGIEATATRPEDFEGSF